MNAQKMLEAELDRLNASSIDILYSASSPDEYELSYGDFETTNLDIQTTLDSLRAAPDRSGADVAWSLVKEHKKTPW